MSVVQRGLINKKFLRKAAAAMAAVCAFQMTAAVPVFADTKVEVVTGVAPGENAAAETSAATETTAAVQASPAAQTTAAVETTAASETLAALQAPAAETTAAETTAAVQATTAAETTAAAQETTAAAQETTAAAGPSASAQSTAASSAASSSYQEDGGPNGFWTGFNGGPGVVGTAAQGSASQGQYPVRNAASKVDGFYFNDSAGMYTYSQMESDLNALKSKYSGVTTGSLCTTPDGRQVYHVMIGNQSAGKKLLITGSMHGREYLTTTVVMRHIKKLLDEKNNGGTVLNDVCVHFVPMMDPDGVAISQYGIDGLQTTVMKDTVRNIMKSWADWEILTNQDKYNWYLNKWKNTANGVDLNQNFPTDTWSSLQDARNKPASDMYKGPSAGSETETRAMMALVDKYHYTAVVNYHAQGQIIYADDDKASELVRNRCNQMGAVVKGVTGYILPEPHEGSFDDGAFKSWLNVNKGIPAVTIEVGSGTCPLPESDITGIWEKNKDVVNAILADMLTW